MTEAKSRLRGWLGDIFDRTFLVFACLLAASSGAVYVLRGPEMVSRILWDAADLMLIVAPRMLAALLLAAFIQVLVPRDLVARLIGAESGARGVFIASIAGALTPGGPLTCFPMVVALHASGAHQGALIAYLTAWAMLGAQRILVWELPLMGNEFMLTRLAASFALPVIAGLIALKIPLRLKVPPRGEV